MCGSWRFLVPSFAMKPRPEAMWICWSNSPNVPFDASVRRHRSRLIRSSFGRCDRRGAGPIWSDGNLYEATSRLLHFFWRVFVFGYASLIGIVFKEDSTRRKRLLRMWQNRLGLVVGGSPCLCSRSARRGRSRSSSSETWLLSWSIIASDVIGQRARKETFRLSPRPT